MSHQPSGIAPAACEHSLKNPVSLSLDAGSGYPLYIHPLPLPIRARNEPGLPFFRARIGPRFRENKNKPKYAVFWQTDDFNVSHRGTFLPVSGSKQAILHIPKKEAAGRPLLPAKGHYMGRKLGVFWRIKRYNRLDFCPWQSEGDTGVFSGATAVLFRGGVGAAGPRDISAEQSGSSGPIRRFPEKSG